jgi:hypothetical protein
VDECSSSPCENGAACVDGINRFECRCARGFQGERCHRATNECASNPCQHGATCHDLAGEYRCVCKAGYTGEGERWIAAVNCSSELQQ